MSEDAKEKQGGRKAHRSERGGFEIFETSELSPPPPRGVATVDQIADFYEHSALAEKCGEEETRAALFEMSEALAPGGTTTVLFRQPGPSGMILAHVWFGPNFDLMRHSHPGVGDCLYYILAGEVLLGKRSLGPGSGFFLPAGMPYKYKVGPEGAELLEFRGGGYDSSQPVMQINEHSLGAIQRLVENARANEHLWGDRPKLPGDLARKTQGTQEK